MNTQRPKILAIDDTPSNLQTLGAALDEEFEMQIASSGAIGLSLAAQSPPDLILLDVMMPQMDGYETLRRLKADPALRTIPVIFLTALSDSESESTGLQLGAADYITKPIKIEITRHRIRNLLEREKLRSVVQAHSIHLEEQVQIRTTALSVALEMAEINNRAKDRFLNNMSHEFRTPLNGILGMAELALYRASDPKLKAQLDKVRKSSEHLLSVINNVLDLTRLEAEKLTLAPVNFRLGTIMESMTHLFGEEAKDKGLEFRVDSAAYDGFVEADSVRLVQILQNMVGNALKFTASGQVGIRSSTVEQSASDMLIRFEVRDTGIGIPLEDQKRIFNAFEQADDSTTRKHGGAGVGLAISKRLAALMGGEIGVESAMGSGSLFWFSARLKKSAVQAEAVIPESSFPANSAKERVKNKYQGAHILLAEEDLMYQEIITFILEENGFVVDVAEDGGSVVEMASRTGYAALMINPNLLALKDAQVVKVIRAIPGREHLAMLMITDDDTDRYREWGMNDSVNIPLDQEKLFVALEKSLALSLAQAENSRKRKN
jgi:signal transduction histidine kinase